MTENDNRIVYLELPSENGRLFLNIFDVSAFREEDDTHTAVFTRGSDQGFIISLNVFEFAKSLSKAASEATQKR